MQYFVVMIDYGRRGREAIVYPEITRREVVSRVASGEYINISFIHEIAYSAVNEVAAEIMAETALREIRSLAPDCRLMASIMPAISQSTRRFDGNATRIVSQGASSRASDALPHYPSRRSDGRNAPDPCRSAWPDDPER
jgi:hypothetical protein